ncbi:MAG: PAS domain S-box protein [Bdellovibrionales bacterium]|nr:PAS domain S-box protein [Bdellovibrionales bacterium]
MSNPSPRNLQKQVEDLQMALDQSSIVAFTDARGVITYVNDRFCEISKYSREELLGKTHQLINSGHHPRSFFSDLWKTISSGRVWKGEVKNRAKDGSEYWVLTTIVPFRGSDGLPERYVAIRTDITSFKKDQEQAENQRAALVHAEKMASLGELAAGIGHELGNPLAALRGRVELVENQIRSGKVGVSEVLKTTEILKNLADRMAAIIRGMKALSRDGTGDPFQSAPLGRILKDVLEFASEPLKRNGIEVRRGLIDESIQIRCQETQISQVFVNLINNARDAALEQPEGKRWIQVDVKDLGNRVEISVTDSGKGIRPEIRERIMVPFFTTKPAGKGSGLGLSVSTAIIENHGGRLLLDLESPQTRFVFSLPKQEALPGN